MSQVIEDKILILKKTLHNEGSLIVSGLNRQGAKMVFYARSALQSRKRFGGGVLEPTHYVLVSYQESKQEGSLYRLTEAQLLEDFSQLRTDYDRLSLALWAVGVVEKMSREGVVDSNELFDLLGNLLRSAETSPHLSQLRAHFIVKLLSIQGVFPTEEQWEKWRLLSVKEHNLLEEISPHESKRLEGLLLSYIN